uniref:Uncharacterized protein n=1 Tax=Rhizophora mucronata TaxID=61149 RepID=A0A2P2PZX9_RHIMU
MLFSILDSQDNSLRGCFISSFKTL